MSTFQGDRGDWLWLAILVILASPVVFLIGLMLGSGLRGTSFSEASNMGLWVSALSTLVIAVLTVVLAKETWQLRRIQLAQVESIRKAAIQPGVDIYLQRSNVAFALMDVVVENSGKGAARSIKFEFSGLNGELLTDHEQLIVEKMQKLNILNKGILSLGSGQLRKSFAFSHHDIFAKAKEEFFDIKIQIRITYQDIEGKNFESFVIWDFSEYVGISEVGGEDPHYSSAKELERIRKVLEAFKRGSSLDRLKVDVLVIPPKNS